jgi:hypothetical protein
MVAAQDHHAGIRQRREVFERVLALGQRADGNEPSDQIPEIVEHGFEGKMSERGGLRQAEDLAEFGVKLARHRESAWIGAGIVLQKRRELCPDIARAHVIVDREQIVAGISAHDAPGIVEGDQHFEAGRARNRGQQFAKRDIILRNHRSRHVGALCDLSQSQRHLQPDRLHAGAGELSLAVQAMRKLAFRQLPELQRLLLQSRLEAVHGQAADGCEGEHAGHEHDHDEPNADGGEKRPRRRIKQAPAPPRGRRNLFDNGTYATHTHPTGPWPGPANKLVLDR